MRICNRTSRKLKDVRDCHDLYCDTVHDVAEARKAAGKVSKLPRRLKNWLTPREELKNGENAAGITADNPHRQHSREAASTCQKIKSAYCPIWRPTALQGSLNECSFIGQGHRPAANVNGGELPVAPVPPPIESAYRK